MGFKLLEIEVTNSCDLGRFSSTNRGSSAYEVWLISRASRVTTGCKTVVAERRPVLKIIGLITDPCLTPLLMGILLEVKQPILIQMVEFWYHDQRDFQMNGFTREFKKDKMEWESYVESNAPNTLSGKVNKSFLEYSYWRRIEKSVP